MAIDIGLKDNARKSVAEALARILADTATLYQKTHGYHWNVTGPSFPYLHTMFEQQYQELWAALDPLAERIRALGHMAPGSFKEYAELARLDESAKPPAAKKMIETLVADHEALVRYAREVKDLAESVGDAETGDMMIERMQVHAKTAWMLRAQLQ